MKKNLKILGTALFFTSSLWAGIKYKENQNQFTDPNLDDQTTLTHSWIKANAPDASSAEQACLAYAVHQKITPIKEEAKTIRQAGTEKDIRVTHKFNHLIGYLHEETLMDDLPLSTINQFYETLDTLQPRSWDNLARRALFYNTQQGNNFLLKWHQKELIVNEAIANSSTIQEAFKNWTKTDKNDNPTLSLDDRIKIADEILTLQSSVFSVNKPRVRFKFFSNHKLGGGYTPSRKIIEINSNPLSHPLQDPMRFLGTVIHEGTHHLIYRSMKEKRNIKKFPTYYTFRISDKYSIPGYVDYIGYRYEPHEMFAFSASKQIKEFFDAPIQKKKETLSVLQSIEKTLNERDDFQASLTPKGKIKCNGLDDHKTYKMGLFINRIGQRQKLTTLSIN